MIASLLAALLVQQQTPAEAAMRDCLGKPDPARLACFDAAAAMLTPVAAPTPVEAALPPAPAPAPVAAAPEAPSAPAADFGLPERRDAPEAVTADVASVELGRYGKATITLADGQVWRQIGSDSTTLSRGQARRAERVTIKRAALGSYRMTVEPGGRTVRVRRAE